MKEQSELEELTRLIMLNAQGQYKFEDLAKEIIKNGYRRHSDKEREISQRQDSLTSQMETVIDLCIKHGCYDAQYWINESYFKKLNEERMGG